MNFFTIVFIFVLAFYSYPQADLMIDFLMYDNAAPPYNGSFELTFGLDSTATDGIDAHLGESAIPPDVCCGLGGPILCAAFDLPVTVDDTWIDYRFGELPYTGVKEHRIWYCSDPTSTVVTIQCSLPPGVTAVLQDWFGGIIFYIEMSDSNEYYINDTWIGIGMDFIVTYDNVLPVEIKFFTGLFLNSSVQINWTTATETNNSGFEILRKGQNDEEWNKIGFIPGFGTTTEPKSYSFTDENVNIGTYKYRLKQIDFDGSFEYSNEIEVVVDFTPKEFMLYQNYPNPFNPSTTIKYALPVESTVRINIYNSLGEMIEELTSETHPEGNYEITWNAQNNSSGVYYYSFEVYSIDGSQSHREMKKIVFLK